MPITKATQRVIDGITSTGGSTSRLLQDRFADVVNVKDFGAVGDVVTDDTAAINAAILAASTSPQKIVFIPGGIYRVTSTIVIPDVGQQGLWILGAGKTNAGALTSQGVSTILVDQTTGVGVKIEGANTVFQYIQVRGSATRFAATNLNLHGILLEAPDIVNLGVRAAWIHGCSSREHPGSGLVTSGNCVQTKIEDVQVRSCKGHGFVLDDGTITGRTNKDRPGMMDIINCRTFDVAGHSILAGNSGTAGVYRLRVENFETGTHTTGNFYNPAIFLHPSEMWLHGDNIFVERCALSGSVNGVATIGGIFISGKTNRITSNRFVGISVNAVYIGVTPGWDTYGTTVDGMYVATTSSILNPAVFIQIGALGTIVVNTSDERITNAVGGDLSSVVVFYESGSIESSDTITAKKFLAQNATSSDTIELNRVNSALGIKIERTGVGATTGRMDCIGGEFLVSTSTANNIVIQRNSDSNRQITVKSNTINLKTLPTSSAGLVSGDLWNNSGVVNIIP